MLHVLEHGGANSAEKLSVNYEMAWLFEAMAYCAVDCFVVISGFVGYKKKLSGYRNLIGLWVQVMFYSVFITVLSHFRYNNVNFSILVSSFFPVFSKQYWFFTSYFVMILFAPIVNSAIQNSNERTAIFSALILCIVFSMSSFMEEDPFGLYKGYSVLWFIALYYLGGIINKHNIFGKIKNNTLIFGYCLSVLITWLIKYMLDNKGSYNSNILYSYISPTIIIETICLVRLFSRISIAIHFIKKIITNITPLVFSVYLIHDHPIVREYAIKDRFCFITDKPLFFFIVDYFGGVLLIFMICIVADMIRDKVFKTFHITEMIRLITNRLPE